MVPTPLVKRDDPPSRIAQVGLFWDITTSVIDFGLSLFDLMLVAKEWLRNRKMKDKKKAKLENKKEGLKTPQKLRKSKGREFKRVWME